MRVSIWESRGPYAAVRTCLCAVCKVFLPSQCRAQSEVTFSLIRNAAGEPMHFTCFLIPALPASEYSSRVEEIVDMTQGEAGQAANESYAEDQCLANEANSEFSRSV